MERILTPPLTIKEKRKMEKQELQKVHTEAVSFDNSKSLPLRYADRKVLEFVNERIAKKEPVTTENLTKFYILSTFSEQTQHRKMEYRNGKWEYGFINAHKYFLEQNNWREQVGLAKCWFKYHIGNLVMLGYLIALPVIQLNEQKQIQSP